MKVYRLGFQKYSYSSNTNLGYLNSDEEQEKDLEVFRRKRIDEKFLKQIFLREKDDMWFPGQQLLLDSAKIFKAGILISTGSRLRVAPVIFEAI